jgi:hypothetical protein
MLSLSDLHHLEAAEGWLERKQYAECFDEQERVDYNHGDDARVLALRWELYNADQPLVGDSNPSAGTTSPFRPVQARPLTA